MQYRSSQNTLLSPSFSALRGSLLAALGLATAACGGNVTSGTGGTGGATSGCENPTPILQPDGSESGYVKCADGAINRVAPVACVGAAVVDSCAGTEDTLDCTTAADCTGGPNGTCQSYAPGPGGPTYCSCLYQCNTDADCAAGEACVCAGVFSTSFCAQKGDCLKGEDCATTECGLASYTDGCGTSYYTFCRAGSDVCRVDADCGATQNCAKTDVTGTWKCTDATCTIGRPLLVDGTLLFAPAARRVDWADEDLRPETASLTPALRAALAAHFSAMAAMEHASIGSFARFSLELLALGAPPSLLAATHEAAADEILHARLSYSLATAYSGDPVGPGPLPITGVAPSTEEEAILRALVREACVGESTAAAEALALSTMVEDPALRRAHARIAEDEGRHAELGWRSLAWMLARNPALAPVAEQAFSEAIASMSSAPLVASDIVSPAHGLLSSEALATLRSRAIAEIVEPCRRALSSAPRAASPRATSNVPVALA